MQHRKNSPEKKMPREETQKKIQGPSHAFPRACEQPAFFQLSLSPEPNQNVPVFYWIQVKCHYNKGYRAIHFFFCLMNKHVHLKTKVRSELTLSFPIRGEALWFGIERWATEDAMLPSTCLRGHKANCGWELSLPWENTGSQSTACFNCAITATRKMYSNH